MEVAVTDYATLESSSNKPYVVYILHCKHNGIEWELKKRYSEFLSLHTQLCKYFSSKQLPKFPPKLIFGNMKKENIVKRKLALNMYINEVLSNEALYDYDDVHEFLQTKKHVKEKIRKSDITQKDSLHEVKATFDYNRQDESELEFKKGDIIVVLQKDTSGWWYGYLNSQPDVCGFFPNTFVEYTNPNSSSERISSDGSLPQPSMTAPTGSPTTTTNISAATSSSTTSVTNKTTSNATTSVPQKSAKVLFDYTADGKDELTIKVGELLDIIDAKEGWCYVKKKEGELEEGYVPEDYLQVL